MAEISPLRRRMIEQYGNTVTPYYFPNFFLQS